MTSETIIALAGIASTAIAGMVGKWLTERRVLAELRLAKQERAEVRAEVAAVAAKVIEVKADVVEVRAQTDGALTAATAAKDAALGLLGIAQGKVAHSAGMVAGAALEAAAGAVQAGKIEAAVERGIDLHREPQVGAGLPASPAAAPTQVEIVQAPGDRVRVEPVKKTGGL